jgi:Skp family chaperone for outer membrane proteins
MKKPAPFLAIACGLALIISSIGPVSLAQTPQAANQQKAQKKADKAQKKYEKNLKKSQAKAQKKSDKLHPQGD